MAKVQQSVIVPVFNGRRHLPLFWRSLIANTNEETEIIVVDDGSDRPVRGLLRRTRGPTVRFIRSDVSRGFATAVNEGLAVARGRVVFLLNSDLILRPGCLESLVDTAASDERVGVAAAKLVYPQTGRVQHAGLAFTRTNHYHVFRHAAERHSLVSRPRVVQAVAFAACAMRREVVEEIGALDAAYINGYEDLDYCFRLRDAGYDSVVDADATAFHWERQSGSVRSVLRKDNVARLWARWGASIRSDLLDYLDEALRVESEATPTIRAERFTLVNLARGAAAADVASFLTTSAFLHVRDCWELNQRRTLDERFWLPLLLPVDAARHRNAFVYLVDEIPQLDENHYWFELRRQIVAVELAVDLNANVVALRGIT